MSPLQFKIFNGIGVYVAATRAPEEALMLVSALGHGCEIRTGHRKVDAVWREGFEVQRACDSYDVAANIIRERPASLHGARLRMWPARGASMAHGQMDGGERRPIFNAAVLRG